MTNSDFTIKNASKMLQCTTQNIYAQKENLMSLGYMKYDKIEGYYLTTEGMNYLRDKRAVTIKNKTVNFNQFDSKDLSNNENTAISNSNEIIVLLKEQLKEEREEKDYWRKQAKEKDYELKEKNLYIQELNTKAFSLLGTVDQDKKQEETTKKSFWKRLFN